MTPASQRVLSCWDRATRTTTIRWFAPRTKRESDMTEDIIVVGGLASVFCWTFIILPLLYHYNWVT
jgi:hypothetical protein